MNITLQSITKTQHRVLYDLMSRIYPPSYKQLWKNKDCNWYINSQYGKANFNLEIEKANTNYCFILNEETPIGILRLVHQKEDSSTKLHRLYIDQEYHGKGLGKKIIKLAEEIAITNNSKSIWLEAMDTQLQALEFYKKCGFKILETYKLDLQLIHPHLRGMYKMTKQL